MGGSAVKDKRPEVIAALTAAEVLIALAAAKVEQAALSVSGLTDQFPFTLALTFAIV